MPTMTYETARRLSSALTVSITVDADIDETVDQALANGWTVETLAKQINRGLDSTASTGLVVYRLREAAKRPAPGTKRGTAQSSAAPMLRPRHAFEPNPELAGLYCARCAMLSSNRHHE